MLKLGFWDKMKALEQLAKHHGLLAEKIDLNITLEISRRLDAGRKRVAEAAAQRHPARVLRSAIVLRPSTILDFHRMLRRRKYQWLFAPRRRRTGPKGPSQALVDAIVEMKRRNPRWGDPEDPALVSKFVPVFVHGNASTLPDARRTVTSRCPRPLLL